MRRKVAWREGGNFCRGKTSVGENFCSLPKTHAHTFCTRDTAEDSRITNLQKTFSFWAVVCVISLSLACGISLCVYAGNARRKPTCKCGWRLRRSTKNWRSENKFPRDFAKPAGVYQNEICETISKQGFDLISICGLCNCTVQVFCLFRVRIDKHNNLVRATHTVEVRICDVLGSIDGPHIYGCRRQVSQGQHDL